MRRRRVHTLTAKALVPEGNRHERTTLQHLEGKLRMYARNQGLIIAEGTLLEYWDPPADEAEDWTCRVTIRAY